MYLKGRMTDIFQWLVSFPNSCNSKGWARLRPRSGNCLGFPRGCQGCCHLSHHLPAPGMCYGEAAELGLQLGLWHRKWVLPVTAEPAMLRLTHCIESFINFSVFILSCHLQNIDLENFSLEPRNLGLSMLGGLPLLLGSISVNNM